MNTLDMLIEDNDGNVDDMEQDYTDDGLFSISSYGADLTFRELKTMMKEKEIEKPDIQRNYIWDKRTASRFVETILLGLPVPSIFLARTDNSKYLIVDGFQRLTTVTDYISGNHSSDQSPFKLSNSIQGKWAGKTFAQLTESEQRLINTTTIHAIIFKQDKPKKSDTSLYQIFERINTGGIKLSPQEIRNSVYHNDFNDTLLKLNKDENWRKLFGPENKRMRDVEFILRFFLLFKNKDNKSNNIISIKKELNLLMDLKQENITRNEIEKYSDIFIKTMETINKLDTSSFKRNNSKFDSVQFDAISISVARKIEEKGFVDISAPEFTEKFIKLNDDEQFKSIFESTRRTSFLSLRNRHDIAYKIIFDGNEE